MKIVPQVAAWTLAAATGIAAAVPTLEQLRPGHRLLIVSVPANDSRLAAQRSALAAWQPQAADRDVAVIVLNGSTVEGVADAAAAIRARYALSGSGFALALVGKDGHVAWRASEPVAGHEIEAVIDAMPMRRAGLR